jgi:hypothetical protein
MSTRALIEVRGDDGLDAGKSLWFYRHSDGHPSVLVPFLNRFLDKVRDGVYRDNLSQACGWLIVLGYQEFYEDSNNSRMLDWKVGAIEPVTEFEAKNRIDIAYRYTVSIGKCNALWCELGDLSEDIDIDKYLPSDCVHAWVGVPEQGGSVIECSKCREIRNV